MISGSLGLIKQSDPEYVVSARTDQKSAQDALDGLRKKQTSGQYSQSTQEMTNQIKASEQSKTDADDKLQKALDRSKNQSISGIEVFSRIPLLIKTAIDIWKEDSVHAIGIFNAVIFIMVFGAFIEAAMVFLVKIIGSFTDEEKPDSHQRRQSPEQPPAAEMVERWVDANYMALKSGQSEKIIDQRIFKRFHEDRKIYFPDGAYKAILEAAIRTGVVAADGQIIEKEKPEAIRKILTTALKWRNINRGEPDG